MIFIYLWFTENNLADLEKSSSLLVELPPEVNKEPIINSSLSTTNNCSDSGTNKIYILFYFNIGKILLILIIICIIKNNLYYHIVKLTNSTYTINK